MFLLALADINLDAICESIHSHIFCASFIEKWIAFLWVGDGYAGMHG